MYHFNDLLVKNGSYFDKRSELPFTGAISGKINLLKSSMPAEVKGYFKNGKLHGRWQWFLIERETHIEGHFSNGLLHGLWESHDKNNNLILHINFNNSEKDGPFRINNENNVKKIEGTFKKNKKHGIWKYYYSDGALKSDEKYEKGLLDGAVEHFLSNGNIWLKRSYKKGKAHGIWERFYDNGQIMYRGFFEMGFKDGYWEAYKENGAFVFDKIENDFQPTAHKPFPDWFTPTLGEPFPDEYMEFYHEMSHVGYQVGESNSIYLEHENGPCETFYENGQFASKGNCASGQKNGLWKFYFPDGTIKKYGNYTHGKKEGYWKFYYPDGSLQKSGNYTKDTRHGYWDHYAQRDKEEVAFQLPSIFIDQNYLRKEDKFQSARQEKTSYSNLNVKIENIDKKKALTQKQNIVSVSIVDDYLIPWKLDFAKLKKQDLNTFKKLEKIMLTENQEDWDLIKEKLETSFNYGSETLWNLSSEIVAIQVNLSDETSQSITNKSLYQINGEEVGNYALKHNNNFVIVVVQKAIGQAGTLGIWDIKLNDWCFSISAELFCVDHIDYDEKTDQFFGTYTFNFPMSTMEGMGNFKVTKNRDIIELDYRFVDQSGKETRGIGKNLF